MEIQQLELDLWQSLETAAQFPQTADFPKLYNALDSAIAPQSTSEQLILGAERSDRSIIPSVCSTGRIATF